MRGFTLIEVLVVVAIMAAVSALVVLRLGQWSSPDDPERVLERLAARLGHQCEQALFQGRARGLRLADHGYDFWALGPEGWQALADRPANRRQSFPDALTVELELAGQPAELDLPESALADPERWPPQITCQPLGELTPFRLALIQGRQSWELEGYGSGRLERRMPADGP